MVCQVPDLDHSTPCLQTLEYHSQVNQLAVSLARDECQVRVSLENQVQGDLEVLLTYQCHLAQEVECQIWDLECHLAARTCHQEDLGCQEWDLEDLICQVNQQECLDLGQTV